MDSLLLLPRSTMDSALDRYHHRQLYDNPYASGHCTFEAMALSNPLTQGMGYKQGVRLIRSMHARAYQLPRVWKALGQGRFLDEKERKRCPQYTTESMAAEDAAEAAAALRDSRDVDQNHWIPGFCKARASMMAQVNCELPTTSLWEYKIDGENIASPLTTFHPLIVVSVGDKGTHFTATHLARLPSTPKLCMKNGLI